jgi:hypothetical protein
MFSAFILMIAILGLIFCGAIMILIAACLGQLWAYFMGDR